MASSKDFQLQPEIKLDRNVIAIHVEDGTNCRLLEGLAVQLNLESRFIDDGDLSNPQFMKSVAIVVADVEVASKYRDSFSSPENPDDELHPALVAVVPVGYDISSLRNNHKQPFDSILILPQIPGTVLAQLSVTLYAHRATVKRVESAMDELHLNRRIFRSLTSGISIASAKEPDFPLSYVNPAFEIITGYALEEIVGQNCRFLQGKERDQPARVLIREAMKEKRSTTAILKNFRKDGTAFWNELSMSPIFDRSGNVTHYVGIQNDVTARVAFEEALRESEKLAATGRLAASIAHEINNPLEAVTNLIYLARQEDNKEQKNNYLHQAEDELSRAASLTTQSLKFYRQSTKPTANRPMDILSAVLGMYATKMKSWGVMVEMRYSTRDSIVCLESEIRQVVSNLVRNAMDSMRVTSGGMLKVRVRNSTRWTMSEKGITITVADTGEGMTEETKQRLFQAFYTTKEEHDGTGLGLWLSREIVARHHGHLSFRSTQGKGTVFNLFLPFQAIYPTNSETV